MAPRRGVKGGPRSPALSRGARRRREPVPRVIAVSGPSGAGKTRLLARLVPALARRGVACAVVKHTRHPHAFDRPGKDTDVLRRAGAVAAAIAGPRELAFFGPAPRGRDALAALVALMPPVPLVLAEGFRDADVDRIEVHRRSVSREFLCARDPRVFAIVTDEPPPRAVPAFGAGDAGPLADLVRARLRLGATGGGHERLPRRSRVITLLPESGRTVAPRERGRMAKKTTSRKSGSRGGRRSGATKGNRGSAGGRATLRARGPEFYSEIGRKGGKRSAAARRRASSGRGKSAGRGGRRSGGSSRGRSRSSRSR